MGTCSRSRREFVIGLVVILTVGLTCLTLAQANDAAANLDHEQLDGSSLRGLQIKGPTIPSWSAYMRFFNKRYSSLTQQILRHKLFIARAIEAFLTKIKYKLSQLIYYTSINRYSDFTQQECQRLMAGDSDSSGLDITPDDEAGELLTRMINERSAAGKQADGRRRRRRRSADQSHSESPSSNPNYQPPTGTGTTNRKVERSEQRADEQVAADIPAEGAAEIEQSMKRGKFALGLAATADGVRSVVSGALSWITPSTHYDEEEEEEEEEEEPEEEEEEDDSEEEEEEAKDLIILSDWRSSGCIGPVIDQGPCDSCYAITSTNFIEWSLCQQQPPTEKNEKRYTKLSVQYLVSCGLQHSAESGNRVRFSGCDSGITRHAFEFFKEYGVELEENMPYLERVSDCPVKPETPIEQRGYFRPQVERVVRLSRTTTQLDLALKAGPVIVTMWEPRYFVAYGGGVIADCDQRGGHATLIVGTALQDGDEYLLIKNSFGAYWGEEGYFKFKRSSIEKCVKEFIVPRVSFPSS